MKVEVLRAYKSLNVAPGRASDFLLPLQEPSSIWWISTLSVPWAPLVEAEMPSPHG